MSLSIRIKNVIDKYSKNPSQFAKRIDFNSETVRKVYIGDTQDPKSSMLNAILETFPEIDALWLMTGKGEMLNTNKTYLANTDAYNMVADEGELCVRCAQKDGKIAQLIQEKENLTTRLEKKAEEIGRLKELMHNK